MNLYRSILRPILFSVDPERAHNQALRHLKWAAGQPTILSWMDSVFSFEDDRLAQDYFGLRFGNNPLYGYDILVRTQ